MGAAHAPGGQHVEAPAAEKSPEGQGSQTLLSNASSVALYEFAGQLVQAVPPADHLPAAQAAQPVPPGTPVERPGGQAAQEAAPASSAYHPTAHCAQDALEDAPAAALAVPAEQGLHVALLDAPVAADQAPGEQGVHADALVPLNLPAGHWAQAAVGAPAAPKKPGAHTLQAAPAPVVPGGHAAHTATRPRATALPAKPTAQKLQEVALGAEAVPGAQRVHTRGEKLPAPVENVLAGQGVHAEALDAASVVLKEPGVQSVHAAAPGARENFPAVQGAQLAVAPAPTEAPKKPGAHKLQEVAPAGAARPLPQAVHAEAPCGDHVFGGHATHAAGCAAKVPAGQLLSVKSHAEAPARPNLPAEHEAQAGAPGAPAKVPGAHAVQASCPVRGFAEPAAQGAQPAAALTAPAVVP